jgi:hypothetical protein
MRLPKSSLIRLRYVSYKTDTANDGRKIYTFTLFKPYKQATASTEYDGKRATLKNITEVRALEGCVVIDKRARSIRAPYMDVSKERISILDGSVTRPSQAWLTDELFVNLVRRLRSSDRSERIKALFNNKTKEDSNE